MCGIAGILYKSKNIIPGNLLPIHKMLEAIKHRGPNAEGVLTRDNLALGHRRLSIIDLSNGANQPFYDASERYYVVFNGEIYNYQSIKSALNGVKWRTNSDTEVVVEAWAKWGVKAIDKFKGMFSFAIWDDYEKSLHIVRDRLGVKPLYFYENEECLVFASEIRSLLASGLVPKTINSKALHDYLSFQSIASPISIIKDVRQLEAGSYLVIRNNEVKNEIYWDITNPSVYHEYTNQDKIKKNIFDLLFKAVEQRLVSDVPIGAFLSGGIDSSAIVALMTKVGCSTPQTFNISFEEKDFDEACYAEIIAKKYKTNHHKLILKPTIILDELANALNAMDSPSGDGINTYVVSKAVKNAGITVALSGIGGDELFAGYPFFSKYHSLYARKNTWNNSYLLRKFISMFMTSGSKWRELLKTKSCNIEEVYPILREVITSSNIEKVLKQPNGELTEIKKTLQQNSSKIGCFPSLGQVSIADLLGYTQNTLLKDADQMSMAVSLEVREPFFDHELVEYVLNIPDTIKYPTYPKKLLVESLGDLLPDEIVHRKKQGFVFPWCHWLKTDLKEFCNSHIESISQRQWFDEKEVKKIWNRFLANETGVKWMDIWMLVVLNYWMEKNLD